MKIICQKADLLNGVNTVLKAVPTRTTLPILECILLDATTESFKLISNDLELGIESTVNAEIIKKGQIALDAKMFSEIVKKLPSSNVEISVDENFKTTIICEKSKFNISGQSGEEFLKLPKIEKDNYIKLSQPCFKEMIHQTIFSIAIEEVRPVLTGELIEINDNHFNIVSVDGHRVSIRYSKLENNTNNINVVVPGKTLNEISKILSSEEDKEVYIYFTDKHILFELNESIVVSRLLEGEFPKYEQIFSKDYETKVTINRKEFFNSIERAALISKDGKKTPIKINITDTNLIITSNTDLGTSYEEVNIIKEGKSLDIAFNPRFLIEALRVIEDEEISIQFTNPLSPCIINQIDGNDYKYLILPIRISS
ncbi:DNA polymerase-3 subunit beta [Natranaerovirga pectinivora]|uniref:Beta sliding clamp n=1 Tax=Natranaerovirga pectinivora TaxID=682400 RepID=A0A4R3MGC8_9FIRM|nr:DNA polymerase III subunit beta [Natranaerovirga pectinivora]TCT12239.1 DNA polymerase-3 subunit beta [Natranaerovirga pectinivora]